MTHTHHPYVVVEDLARHYPPAQSSRLQHLFARLGGLEPGVIAAQDDDEDDVEGGGEADDDDDLDTDLVGTPGERADRHFVALDGVSFRAEGGSCVAFVGPSGCGKTLLLKIIAGIVPPTSGRVEVRGTVAPALDSIAGLLPRRGRFDRILPSYVSLFRLSPALARKRTDAIIEFSGDPQLRRSYVSSTDGRRKVTAIMATMLSLDADVILFDARVGVDEFSRRCLDRLREARDAGALVLMTARSPEAVAGLATRIITMDRGRIVSDEQADARQEPDGGAEGTRQLAEHP